MEMKIKGTRGALQRLALSDTNADAKRRKAAGPDGWANEELAKMPYRWWQNVARLTNEILDRKLDMPEPWVHVSVTLIPCSGGSRAIMRAIKLNLGVTGLGLGV